MAFITGTFLTKVLVYASSASPPATVTLLLPDDSVDFLKVQPTS